MSSGTCTTRDWFGTGAIETLQAKVAIQVGYAMAFAHVQKDLVAGGTISPEHKVILRWCVAIVNIFLLVSQTTGYGSLLAITTQTKVAVPITVAMSLACVQIRALLLIGNDRQGRF
jgi:hypothetical protein